MSNPENNQVENSVQSEPEQKTGSSKKSLIVSCIVLVCLIAASVGYLMARGRQTSAAPQAEQTNASEQDMAELALAEEQAEHADRETVLATIGGKDILKGEVDDQIDYLNDYYTGYGYDVSDEESQTYMKWLALSMVQQQEMMDRKAKELGLDQLSDEVMEGLKADNAAQWEAALENYISANSDLAADATEEEKAAARLSAKADYEARGFTEESTLKRLVDSYIIEQVQAEMVKDVQVTDEEIQARYDTYVNEDFETYGDDAASYEYQQYYGNMLGTGGTLYYMPSGYRGVTHILLNVDDQLMEDYTNLKTALEDQQAAAEEGENSEASAEATEEAAKETAVPVTQEQVDAAYEAIMASVQPTVDEIMEKFNAGTPFSELIEAYGTDPGMNTEPNKSEGYAVHKDSVLWDPAFTEAAMSIPEVGGVSAPTLGSYGVHIVYYLRDIPGGPIELTDAVRSELAAEIQQEKEGEKYSEVMQQWLDEANVVYTDAAAPYLEGKPDDTESEAGAAAE